MKEYSYKEILDLKETELTQYLKKIDKKEKLKEISDKCFSELLKDSNFHQNCNLFIELNEYLKYEKNSFKKEDIGKIFEIYKTYLEEFKKNNGQEKTNTIQLNFIIILIQLSDNKKELLDFLLENINLINAENIPDLFKNVPTESLYNSLLTQVESRNKSFENINQIEFYKYIYAKYNCLKQNFDFTKKNKNDESRYKIEFKKDIEKIEDIGRIFDVFLIQKIDEYIKKMTNFLFDLFYENYLSFLLRKSKDIFMNTENSNIIKLYKDIIKEKEEKAIVKKKSHLSLCKKCIISINESNKSRKFYGNTSINEIYDYLIDKEQENNYTIKKRVDDKEIILDKFNDYIFKQKNNNAKEEKILDKLSNDTLDKLMKENNSQIYADKIEKNKDKLITDGKLTENFEKVLRNCFKKYSKGKSIMNINEFCDFYNKLSNTNLHDKSVKILIFLRDNTNYYKTRIVEENEIIKFFQTKEGKKEILWDNIKNMNLLPDLTEKPKKIDFNEMPRYFLINNVEKYKDLNFIDEFTSKYNLTLNEEIFDFFSFLSTNENIYNDTLNCFKNDNSIFTKKSDEYIHKLYKLIIIESIFQDLVVYENNDICLKDNNENIGRKKQFFNDFIDNGYVDLINYSSILLKILNEKNIKNANLIMRCCSKCLKIVNIIYDSYFSIKFDIKKKDNEPRIYIEYDSLINLLKQNRKSDIIKKSATFKELAEQILIYINNKHENEDIEINEKLIMNSYLILFSLLYTNEDIFNYLNEKAHKNELNDVINNIIVSKNKSFKSFIVILMYKFIKNENNKIPSHFLSYLFSLLFGIIKKKENEEKMGMIKLLLQSLINKQVINKNCNNNQIIEVFKYFYDYIKYEYSKNKNNEPILQIIDYIIDSLMKIKEIDSNAEIKKLLEYKFDNNMSLFRLCINKFIEERNEKKNKKKEKESNIVKLLDEDKENKFISCDKLKEKLNEINERSEKEKNEKEKNEKEKNEKGKNKNDNNKTVESEMLSYCSLCLKKGDKKKFFLYLVSKLYEIKEKEDNEIKSLSGPKMDSKNTKLKHLKKKKIKKISEYIGIRNLGNLCYLDSVIQQLFYIPLFKYSIMNADDKKSPIKSDFLDDDNLLHQIQKIFTQLTFTAFGEVIPKDLIFSIKDFDGNPINPNNMQDSHEFYTNFCDKIEECLHNTKYKYLIKNLFIGKICNVNTCSSCKHIRYRFEDFKDLTLEVNDLNDIYESLDKYISNEKIEDYFCENCNQTVDLNKATLIANLPNILIIHLNRIKMNMVDGKFEKIYSKFTFPTELNLKKYCIEEIIEKSTNIYKKKDEYYEYKLKGVNIHSGNVEGGHYISIIKVDKDKWYQFDDNKVKEFDIKNLGKECFGGKEEENNNKDKKNSAYLLFYELSKKKPIKILLNENKIDKLGKNIIEYNNKNAEEIENEYDISKLENGKDENEILKIIFKNTDDNSYYKYMPYDNIVKNVNKEYFREVFNENKSYDYLYGLNTCINFNNYLMKLVIDATENDYLNFKELKSEDYKRLVDIFTDLIISYISDDNFRIHPNEKYIQSINNIISKFFFIFNTIDDHQNICNYICDKLFSNKNVKLLFCGGTVKEISDNLSKLFLRLMESSKEEKKQKVHESLNKIINEEDNISIKLYEILFELIKNNIKGKELDNNSTESFLILYYKLYKENKEKLNKVNEILKYLITEKDILSKKEDIIGEIKSQINDLLIKNLFDTSFDILIILIKHLQYNDENYSNNFNTYDIQKLYKYCLKEKDDESIKEKQIKLIKFIFSIFEIKDKYTLDRIQLLLGYPTLIFKKDKEKNISLFGVKIMNNDINTEIFEYISYNHIKKKRCVLRLLFPSKNENNIENKLDENSRNDLIYELIRNCLGLNNNNEGNYLLFKSLYLMQSTSVNFNNLYQEMKEILKKANKNNKYDLSSIEKAETECIKLIDYEKKKMIEAIKNDSRRDLSGDEGKENKNMEKVPKLSKKYKYSDELIDEKNYKSLICDVIPDEIGKIEIVSAGENKNFSIFRLEYYTTYFLTKELKNISENKNAFTYAKIKKQRNESEESEDEEDDRDEDNELSDISLLNEKKNENELFEYFKEKLKEKKKIIIKNPEVIEEKKKIKKTLIRYYLLSSNKKVIKITPVEDKEMNKEKKNNYYLPKQINICTNESQVVNIINIHRIKNKYKFLDQENLTLKLKTSANAEKYQELLE